MSPDFFDEKLATIGNQSSERGCDISHKCVEIYMLLARNIKTSKLHLSIS